MQRPRRDFLAGARLAEQEHGRWGWRQPPEQLAQLVNRRRAPDQPRDTALALLELAAQDEVFAQQRRAFDRPPHRRHHLRQTKWLEDEIGRPGTQRVDRGFNIGKRRHQDHLAGKAGGAQLLEPVDARFAGQRDVKNDQVESLAAEHPGRKLGALNGIDMVAATGQCATEKVEHPRLVVDHQHRDRPGLHAIGRRFIAVCCVRHARVRLIEEFPLIHCCSHVKQGFGAG